MSSVYTMSNLDKWVAEASIKATLPYMYMGSTKELKAKARSFGPTVNQKNFSIEYFRVLKF